MGNTGIWLILKSDKCIIQLNLVSFMLIELALKIARLLLAGRLKGSFFFFFLDSLNPYLWALYTTLLQTLLKMKSSLTFVQMFCKAWRKTEMCLQGQPMEILPESTGILDFKMNCKYEMLKWHDG